MDQSPAVEKGAVIRFGLRSGSTESKCSNDSKWRSTAVVKDLEMDAAPPQAGLCSSHANRPIIPQSPVCASRPLPILVESTFSGRFPSLTVSPESRVFAHPA